MRMGRIGGFEACTFVALVELVELVGNRIGPLRECALGGGRGSGRVVCVWVLVGCLCVWCVCVCVCMLYGSREINANVSPLYILCKFGN